MRGGLEFDFGAFGLESVLFLFPFPFLRFVRGMSPKDFLEPQGDVTAPPTNHDVLHLAAPALGVHPEPAPDVPPLGAGRSGACGPHGHPQTRQEGAEVACPPIQGAVPGSAVGKEVNIVFAAGDGGAFHHRPPVPPGPVVEHFIPDRGGIVVSDSAVPSGAAPPPFRGEASSSLGGSLPSGIRSSGLSEVGPVAVGRDGGFDRQSAIAPAAARTFTLVVQYGGSTLIMHPGAFQAGRAGAVARRSISPGYRGHRII